MPGGRILARTAVLLAGVALALAGGGALGLLPAGAAIIPAAAFSGLSALLTLAAARRGRPAGIERPSPPARTAFGPAVDAADTLAVCAVERGGRITYWNAGAARLFGRPVREMEGASSIGTVVPKEEERAFLQEIEAVFASGHGRSARRIIVTDDAGRRVELARTLVPVLRYGKAVEVALVFSEIRAAGLGEKQARLLDSTPVALVGLDAEGRIESANLCLSEWTGRRVEVLEGVEIARADIFPPSLCEALSDHALRRRRATDLPAVAEYDDSLLSADGTNRPVHVVVAARPGGGADAAFVDGTSRRRLLEELEVSRGALAEGRKAAAEVIEATTREIQDSAREVADAVRRTREERSGPVQKARAEADLAETTREFLRRVGAIRAGRRPSAPRALLVEDNDENRDLLAHMLRSRGAEVVVARSGVEAIELASREPFSFVLLDLQMPEMDGFQVVRRLRALPGGGTLPVVALTALTSDEVRRRCETEGMNDFVTKPVKLARIRELVDRWSGVPSAAGQRLQTER